MPAGHYAKVAPQVQAICRKYGLSYNTGRFGTQLKQVLERIYHFSKPSEKEWQAHVHSVENVDSTTHKDDRSAANLEKKVEDKLAIENTDGLTRFLPPVVRKAISYAW